jgi:hypothetical protein
VGSPTSSSLTRLTCRRLLSRPSPGLHPARLPCRLPLIRAAVQTAAGVHDCARQRRGRGRGHSQPPDSHRAKCSSEALVRSAPARGAWKLGKPTLSTPQPHFSTPQPHLNRPRHPSCAKTRATRSWKRLSWHVLPQGSRKIRTISLTMARMREVTGPTRCCNLLLRLFPLTRATIITGSPQRTTDATHAQLGAASSESMSSTCTPSKHPLPMSSHQHRLPSRHMLGPERPEAVLPDRALYLPTFSQLLMTINFSLPPSLPLSSSSPSTQTPPHPRRSRFPFHWAH